MTSHCSPGYFLLCQEYIHICTLCTAWCTVGVLPLYHRPVGRSSAPPAIYVYFVNMLLGLFHQDKVLAVQCVVELRCGHALTVSECTPLLVGSTHTQLLLRHSSAHLCSLHVLIPVCYCSKTLLLHVYSMHGLLAATACIGHHHHDVMVLCYFQQRRRLAKHELMIQHVTTMTCAMQRQHWQKCHHWHTLVVCV